MITGCVECASAGQSFQCVHTKGPQHLDRNANAEVNCWSANMINLSGAWYRDCLVAQSVKVSY